MWAQRLRAPQTFEACEVPAPGAEGLAAGQVLLATAAGAVCGSDLPAFRGELAPDAPAGVRPWPERPGYSLHEVAGTVVASRHPEIGAGDEVVGWASGFDGLAELVVTDGDGLCHYDPGLPPETAVLLQPLACVLYAVEQIRGLAGASVAVLGQGPIGLLFSHVAASAGARSVVGVDRVDRGGLAASFGVDEAVHAPSDRWVASLAEAERPEVVIEAIGHQTATLDHAVAAVAPGGQIYYFGVPDDPSYPFNLRLFLRKDLTLRSGVTHERRRVLAAADDYLREHPSLAKSYITDVLGAEAATEAFTRAAHPRPEQLKIVVRAR
jgi:threonine dehydrogenase-like Zn-dependent dehydrogenase